MTPANPITYIPPSQWDTIEHKSIAGVWQKRIHKLYWFMLPAVFVMLFSMLIPASLKIYIQIIDIIVLAVVSILIFIFTIISYNVQKNEEDNGYTTWKKFRIQRKNKYTHY